MIEEIQREFQHAFGEDGGTLSRAFDGFQDGLAEQIAEHFGADRSTAVQHQIKEGVSKLVEERMQRPGLWGAGAHPFPELFRDGVCELGVI